MGKVIGSQLSQLAGQVWELDGIAAFADSNAFADVHVWQPTTFADADAEGNDAREALPLCDEIERAVRMSAPQSCGKMRRTPTNVRRASARSGLYWMSPSSNPVNGGLGITARFPGRLDGRAAQFPLRCRPMRSRGPMQKSKKRFNGAGCRLAAGDESVEIGCAPGGASQALLDRGLFVTGIDPADVDPVVLSHPKFRHLKKRGKEVRRTEFLGVRWLVADMNIAPEATLDEVEAIVTHAEVTIRGLILTLKLSDWSRAGRAPGIRQTSLRLGLSRCAHAATRDRRAGGVPGRAAAKGAATSGPASESQAAAAIRKTARTLGRIRPLRRRPHILIFRLASVLATIGRFCTESDNRPFV